MSVIATETWTGANGAAWPAQWTTKMSATGTIQSNQGQFVTTNTAAQTPGRADLTGMAVAVDTDVVVRVAALSSGVEQYAWVGINTDTSGETGFGNSLYELYVQLDYNATAGSSTVSLWQGTNLIFRNARTLTPGVFYGVRVRRYLGTYYGKVWDTSGAEPAAWEFTLLVANTPGYATVPNPTGVVSVGIQNGATTGTRTFYFDDMTVDNTVAAVAWLTV